MQILPISLKQGRHSSRFGGHKNIQGSKSLIHHHFSRMGRFERELSARFILHGLASDFPELIFAPEARFDIINIFYQHQIDMGRFEDVWLGSFCVVQNSVAHNHSLYSTLSHTQSPTLAPSFMPNLFFTLREAGEGGAHARLKSNLHQPHGQSRQYPWSPWSWSWSWVGGLGWGQPSSMRFHGSISTTCWLSSLRVRQLTPSHGPLQDWRGKAPLLRGFYIGAGLVGYSQW